MVVCPECRQPINDGFRGHNLGCKIFLLGYEMWEIPLGTYHKGQLIRFKVDEEEEKQG